MSYTLSMEEYIFSLLLMDGEQIAASIKDDVFENISNRDLENRLDSATNGLLSRGLITMDQDVDEQFEFFLKKLTNSPRVIRLQIATDSAMLAATLFCNDDYIFQQSQDDNRVVKLFTENNEEALSQLMNISEDKVEQDPFSIKERHFEKVINKLLASKKLTSKESDLFHPAFLKILKEKQGKLNALYDYNQEKQGIANSFLYITGNGQTWSIEGEGKFVTIAPLSFKSLFE
ncbi:hypothetical protein JI666_13780 [Bacillus sp. NTK071]|uniref:hypothetical protein n=1 Tax=Bacillus sp. NTK071 TaxID=2802175 RepID=UPI001A902EEA|nr:hypothetical protein [Bacillus sp. NTK071]MBN8209822.1 hypothetical protein [Bacillus sp. NTK071]